VAVRDADKRLEIAKTQLERTRKKLAREQALGVSGTQEKIDELTSDLSVQTHELAAAELRVVSEKAALESARHELTKVRITSPIDGVVLRINIAKGQNTVMGAMNSAGTELMTVADLSVLQVELDVGEAAILDVRAGQEVRVAIDALPNRKLTGKVTEVGTSPVAPPAGQQDRGVSFRVIVTLDEVVEGVRPGFSASAEIVTATRSKVLAVPIRAVVARELPVDEKEQVITTTPVPAGTKKKLFEGVMRARDGKAQFQAIKVGVTGKEHFEVLEGLAEGDEVVTGPHKTLRDLKEGSLVQGKAEE
ncbi:MAG: efflux RND transporter periplasmic adaptor subunit, partial [Planctomycetota bacterium]